MKELEFPKERALLVAVKLRNSFINTSLEESVKEFEELVNSSGCEVVETVICKRDKPDPKLYIGEGKANELAELCEEKDINVVIFNNDLSFSQQINLEEIIGRKTIDRTQLILDIFAQHAKTQEGKLQVELAQLEYLLPRLKGKGIMLSRLGGGIGTRGPGEKKLEIDRRRIGDRIQRLKYEIQKIRRRRQILRAKRRKENIPLISLVGYTNAGKSTLLNSLTSALQKTDDSMFTTLDPLSKRLVLSNNQLVILTDTVGFIEDLPQHLIEAFMATLEEIGEADLILHILDVLNPNLEKRFSSVLNILKKLHFNEKPQIICLNKIDLLKDTSQLSDLQNKFPDAVYISALKNINLDVLLRRIEEFFEEKRGFYRLFIPHKLSNLLNELYQKAYVKKIDYTFEGIFCELEADKIFMNKFLKKNEVKLL